MTATLPEAPAAAPARPTDPSDRRLGKGRLDWGTWPSYEAAALGYREYWYPVAWSRKVREGKPLAVMLAGERLMLIRDGGTVRALHDRCPHRGVPLSHPLCSQEFEGTWTCGYHGWTFGLADGELKAAITDGPESPITGKVAVRTYPVEERIGLVWVWVGDGEPSVPVESDLPSELLAEDAVVRGRLTVRPGNWRFGAENGFDEGHAKFLHRNSLWTLRRQMPTWTRHHIEPRDEGWIQRVPDEVHYDEAFPGLGTWPRPHRLRTKGRGKATVSIRLPCFLRVAYEHWQHYEWWVPIDAHHHLYLQLVSKRAPRLERLRFAFYYRTWVRWVFHGMFNDEDALMVDVMDAPPERLYRPDIALTEWRNLCERTARGGPQPMTRDLLALAAAGELPPTPQAARRASLPITHRLRKTLLRRD
jgi:phenylpropionate dioxygenase-like ring-hydroxylating dioxygenase large terminal subunit